MAGTMMMRALGKASVDEASGYLVLTSDTDRSWSVRAEDSGECSDVPMAALRCDEVIAVEFVEGGDVWSIRIVLAGERTYTYDSDDRSAAEGLVVTAMDALSSR